MPDPETSRIVLATGPPARGEQGFLSLRPIRPLAAILVLLILAGCAGSGSGGGAEQTTVTTLGWIRSRDGRLVDDRGRQWIFRGMNARVEGIFDGGGEWTAATAAFDEWDAREMARLGFDLLRLPINWSGLEPTEGRFSDAYLAEVDQAVERARAAGLYVLIDFHQDKFSKYTGDDGAPLWAVYPEAMRGHLDPTERHGVSLELLLAIASFFENAEGIQDRFLPAWRLIASRYAGLPHVVGFEVMNEPLVVFLPHGAQKLTAFYEKVARALREVDSRHAIWLEPDVYRNNLLWAPLRETPFPDGNVVYAPHMYPNFIGMAFPTADEWVKALTPTFDHLLAEAASWGAAPMIGEWGTHPSDAFAPALFEGIQRLAASRGIGLAFWVWKERASGNWGLFDWHADPGQWTERVGPGMDALVSGPAILAAPGRITACELDPGSGGGLEASFEARGGEAPPLVYLPEESFPLGFVIELDGAGVEAAIDPGTRRALLPWDGRAGAHHLVIRPGPAA